MVARKKEHIQSMINALKNKEKVIQRMGGFTIENSEMEIEFQQSRLDELITLETMTVEEILQRKNDYESQISVEELSCKGGDLRGLSQEAIIIICKLELIDIALGGA